MSSLADTSADEAARLMSPSAGGDAQPSAGDGSVTLTREQVLEATTAVCGAIATLDVARENATRSHDRTVIRNRIAQLRSVQAMLGPI
jgi:hypothetical protein